MKIIIDDTLDESVYKSYEDVICLLPGETKDAIYHEICHWAGHYSRAGFLGYQPEELEQVTGRLYCDQYNAEECVAEMAAVMLMMAEGADIGDPVIVDMIENIEYHYEDIEDTVSLDYIKHEAKRRVTWLANNIN